MPNSVEAVRLRKERERGLALPAASASAKSESCCGSGASSCAEARGGGCGEAEPEVEKGRRGRGFRSGGPLVSASILFKIRPEQVFLELLRVSFVGDWESLERDLYGLRKDIGE
jgi:hypothetical protein